MGLIENGISAYQVNATKRVVVGERPASLPCETQIGEQCSDRFLAVTKSENVFAAINDLVRRCPHGFIGAIEGLTAGVLIATTALTAVDPCYDMLDCGGGCNGSDLLGCS